MATVARMARPPSRQPLQAIGCFGLQAARGGTEGREGERRARGDGRKRGGGGKETERRIRKKKEGSAGEKGEMRRGETKK